MFFFRGHSVDTDHPLATDYGGFSSSSSPPPPPPGIPRFTERRGMVAPVPDAVARAPLEPRRPLHHPLRRRRPQLLLPRRLHPVLRPPDRRRLRAPFIRNDGMEDRYSVLIELTDQKAADGFYCTFNGKNFSPAEAEVCHILFLHEVDYTESADVASTPPSGLRSYPLVQFVLRDWIQIPVEF
ncbi:hypothetical protein EUGRSUZ_C01413 [Eucalyptus grandis]|uniref:BRCA1-associated 2/ETP1 RRM domain-containing protein n=2 Tax=Eucalyptus grandis TaxID=71139 RepID=A0A059CPD5_EUCGR|nr:hypothetical protein EUGRSUZ_C01413 [Eucalyptus grandis]